MAVLAERSGARGTPYMKISSHSFIFIRLDCVLSIADSYPNEIPVGGGFKCMNILVRVLLFLYHDQNLETVESKSTSPYHLIANCSDPGSLP